MTALNGGLFFKSSFITLPESTDVFVVLFEIFRLKAFLVIHYF